MSGIQLQPNTRLSQALKFITDRTTTLSLARNILDATILCTVLLGEHCPNSSSADDHGVRYPGGPAPSGRHHGLRPQKQLPDAVQRVAVHPAAGGVRAAQREGSALRPGARPHGPSVVPVAPVQHVAVCG